MTRRRRPLHEEPLLATADLGRLLDEIEIARGAATGGGRAAEPPAVAGAPIATVALGELVAGEEGELAPLEELRRHESVRVLVLDVGGFADSRLPSVAALVRHGGLGLAAEEAIGAHAAKCFTALSNYFEGVN